MGKEGLKRSFCPVVGAPSNVIAFVIAGQVSEAESFRSRAKDRIRRAFFSILRLAGSATKKSSPK